ncbi:LapA family protein [Cyanobacterium sp. uoEpiScrs1]|uniref:LapA family protein n=1 Tax=Cyanobacterium sp. uoEpiScrs1 TaxID=2976343 RepID=UPI002269F727|nr:LapA family protein [Cyanobacterium sp. uoEpiScrs1]
MKLLLLLLILVSTIVFLIQNPQPITLYFLGINAKTALLTLTLPVGIWAFLFIILGFLTSLIITLINQFSSSFSLRGFTFPLQASQFSNSSPSSKKFDWGKTSLRNWGKPEQEFDEEDAWDIEEPPTNSTFTCEQLEEPQAEEERATDFEILQSPKKVSCQGSIYSYTYRELRDSENSSLLRESVKPPPKKPETLKSKNKTVDQVYDANYRVLTPPYCENQKSSNCNQEEDQDWI